MNLKVVMVILGEGNESIPKKSADVNMVINHKEEYNVDNSMGGVVVTNNNMAGDKEVIMGNDEEINDKQQKV